MPRSKSTTMAEDREEEWRAALSKPLDVRKFQPSEVELEVAASSVAGNQPYNSDHYLALRLGRLQETLVTSLASGDLPPRFQEYAYAMLVADGLGDHGAGARASRVALSALAYLAIQYGRWHVRIGPDTHDDMSEQGAFLLRRVNDAVIEASRSDIRLASMATSLTAVYIAGTDLFFAHVGHSKAYLFRAGSLIQLTTDQTLEQRRLQAPKPRTLQQPRMDLDHVVTETIGGHPGGPDVQIEHIQMLSGDRVLLCTNGLTDVVSEDQIADVLALQRRPKEDCRRLVDMALGAKSPDNITVMAADYRIRSFPVTFDAPSGPWGAD